MKNLTIIIAMLFIAFTVDAQNTRTRSSGEKKTEKTTATRSQSSSRGNSSSARTSSSSSKSEATRPSSGSRATSSSSSSKSSATRPSSSSRSSATRTTGNSSSSSRSSATRTTGNSSGSSATRPSSSSRSSAERSSSANRGSSTTTTRTTTREVNRATTTRSDNGRTNSSYSSGRPAERTNGTRTVGTSSRTSRNGTNVYSPRTSTVHAEKRKVYTTHMPNRVYRPTTHIHYNVEPLNYRRVHYPYRAPRTVNVYWDVHMYHEYRVWYPHFDLWYYPYGYRIHTISAYDAYSYIGEIARVYGEVHEVWYEGKTDQYFLYFGGPFPYSDFTVILDGHDARRFSRNPVRFFTHRHIEVTGLVSSFEGKPEIMVKNKKQVRPY